MESFIEQRSELNSKKNSMNSKCYCFSREVNLVMDIEVTDFLAENVDLTYELEIVYGNNKRNTKSIA